MSYPDFKASDFKLSDLKDIKVIIFILVFLISLFDSLVMLVIKVFLYAYLLIFVLHYFNPHGDLDSSFFLPVEHWQSCTQFSNFVYGLLF